MVCGAVRIEGSSECRVPRPARRLVSPTDMPWRRVCISILCYSSVFLGKHRPTGRVSALKLFKREVLDASPAAWEQVVVEVKAMELIRHQHVLSLISYGDQGYPHQDGM